MMNSIARNCCLKKGWENVLKINVLRLIRTGIHRAIRTYLAKMRVDVDEDCMVALDSREYF